MDTSNMELILELRKFLSVNRHCLTDEDLELINRIIKKLKKANKLSLNPAECLMHLAQISELALKLFDIN